MADIESNINELPPIPKKLLMFVGFLFFTGFAFLCFGLISFF